MGGFGSEQRISRHRAEAVLRHQRLQFQRGTARALLTALPLAHQTRRDVEVTSKHRLACVLALPKRANFPPVPCPQPASGTSRRRPSSFASTSRPLRPCPSPPRGRPPALRSCTAWSSHVTSMIVPVASIAAKLDGPASEIRRPAADWSPTRPGAGCPVRSRRIRC